MLFDNERLSYDNGDSATVSVANWLIFDLIALLNLVPIVGSIAAIAIYAFIAARQSSSPSVQNRIIVNFIWLGVWLLAAIVLTVLVLVGVLEVDSFGLPWWER